MSVGGNFGQQLADFAGVSKAQAQLGDFRWSASAANQHLAGVADKAAAAALALGAARQRGLL